MIAAAAPAQAPGWLARLELGFAPRAGRTRLVHRRHRGPLVLQRPFHPEGEVCHAYLIHPPGGVVGGDRLELELGVEAGAHALLTTPAANKFYRSAGATALQRQWLTVGEGAALEWLPQEQILFAGARVDALTRVHLAEGARFIGWELSCLGRPASGEGFDSGGLRQRLELWRGGRPLLLERNRFAGGERLLAAAHGLGGKPIFGTLLAVGADAGELAELRERLLPAEIAAVGLTLLDGLLVARYLGEGAEQARGLFTRIWEILRPRLLGRPACPPRIWRT